MSTEQSVDPELVEQTKQQIRRLVSEIHQLSRSEVAPLEFYDGMLNRVVSALAAVGGAIWTVNSSGQLELEYQINLRETRLGESQEAQQQHGRLLRKVLASPEGMLVAPHSGAGEEEEGGNPTDFLLVLGALRSDQETRGILEVFQRPGSSNTVQKGYLRFLLQMCDFAGEYLKTRSLRHYTDRQALWSQLENFTRVAHRSLDPKGTAYTIANEGRRLIECDRVSVGICKGRKCQIEAVSGQDTFDKRSNTVSLLSKLATAVAATGEAVWYTGDTSMMAPQVEDAVQAYVDEAHSKTVAIIPLLRPEETPEDLMAEREPPLVIGVLIVEQIEDSRPKEGLAQRIEVVSDHSSMALANALEYHQLFLLPVWQTLGKAQWVFKARTLPKTIAISIAVVAVLLFLIVWRADFELEGKGTLQPAIRREVFAGVNGVVDKLEVNHGTKVQAGDVLARMHNTDLQTEITETTGKISATQEQILAKQRSLSTKLKPIEENQLRGELAELQMALESLKMQLKLKKEKSAELNVTAPINGEVITWQLRELLLGRPVQQGQILMTVADPAKDWELELHVPEDRMGYIASEVKRQKTDELQVRYILASNPGTTYTGKIKEISRESNIHGDEGNTVLVRVAIDPKDREHFTAPRPGAGATGKIYCGRASIGYVWFHDLVAGFHKLMFKIF